VCLQFDNGTSKKQSGFADLLVGKSWFVVRKSLRVMHGHHPSARRVVRIVYPPNALTMRKWHLAEA
jgi:hypothetical protein